MNVLITSAARKVWLVRAFQAALEGSGRVLAADLTRLSAALHAADASALLPRSDAAGFLDAVRDLCAQEDIGLIVPSRDGELPVFAAAHASFGELGVRVAVSQPEAVETCLDKAAFTRFCLDHGFAVPQPVTQPTAADLPVYARPRRGQAGVGAGVVRSETDLRQRKDHVFAQVVDAPECTVDVFLDQHGKAVSAVPRERVVVVGGESQVTTTVEDPQLAGSSAALCESIGLTGPATVQAFRTCGEVLFIEVNPRFGGASALSFRAGAPGPKWLVEETGGATLSSCMGQYERGLTMLRYGADLFVGSETLR